MGRQQAERHTGPEIGPHLNGSLKVQNSGLTTNGPTDLWVVNRMKDTPGRKLAQHLNGSLKGRNSGPNANGPTDLWVVGPEISPTFKWVAKRPKDVHPENWPIH